MLLGEVWSLLAMLLLSVRLWITDSLAQVTEEWRQLTALREIWRVLAIPLLPTGIWIPPFSTR
jgi:hypothetical protein